MFGEKNSKSKVDNGGPETVAPVECEKFRERTGMFSAGEPQENEGGKGRGVAKPPAEEGI